MHKKQKAPLSKILKHQQKPSSLDQVLSAYYKTRNKSAGTKYSKNHKMNHSNPKGKKKIQGNSKANKQTNVSKTICENTIIDDNAKKFEYVEIVQTQNQKRSLQIKYLKVVQELFDKIINPPTQNTNKKQLTYEQKLRNTIPETILYFLGSVVQKIKKQNLHISYLQFIDQCIKVFQRSSYVDIRQFLDLAQQLNKPLVEINPFRKIQQNQQIVHIVQSQQETTRNRIRKNSILKVQQQPKQIPQQIPIQTSEPLPEIKILQPTITKTPKKVKFQDLIKQPQQKSLEPPHTNYDNYYQPNKYLQNLPIIASVQSKAVEQTPNICCETLKSQVSSPIRKIDRKEEKSSLNVSSDCFRISAENNSSVLVETNNILTKINSNIDRLSKTLQFPPPSPKIPYQPHSPLHTQNTQKLEHLHQKYSHLSRKQTQPPQQHNKQNITVPPTTHLFEITKYQSNINYEKLRSFSTNRERACVGGDDERIDRITAKVQEYISRNSIRIQNNMRNVSQLKKCQ